MLNYFCILLRKHYNGLLRGRAINYYMPVGHEEAPWDTSPDKSPVMQYNVKVSQRDLEEIRHLVDRNFAGMTIAWLPVSLAVTRIIQQINDLDKNEDTALDNYDNDGACPVCKAPSTEQDDPYD